MEPSASPEPASRPVRALRALAASAGALLAACPAPGVGTGAGTAPEPEQARIGFAFHGRPVATLELDALKLLAAPREVRVSDPYEEREIRFLAFDFAELLDGVYGEETWRQEQELLFRCRDGYEPTIPVRRFLEHRAWLAFQRIGSGFSLAKRESGELRRVALAPFYLVWENLDDAGLRQEGDYGWPYQLEGVDVIRTRERFPRMRPPDGAPRSVQAGFEAFRIHCSRCHALYGEGGRLGPELHPEVVQALGRDWLRRWIDDPGQIAANARMERLNPALSDRERVIDSILDYLDAMAAAGPAPESGPGH